MKYLLDTNVLSELRRGKKNPNKKVIEFVGSISIFPTNYNIYISCITIGEIRKGINECKDSLFRTELDRWFETFLIGELKEQIIDINSEIMEEWGRLMVEIKDLQIIDSLIAATCLTHNLTIVTRNVKDFERISKLKIINPF